MKKFVVAFLVALGGMAFAESIALEKGLNVVSKPGKLAAVEIVTVDAAQAVAIKSVCEVTQLTNAYKSVVTPRVKFAVTLTNWYGAASVLTNVYDRLDLTDFRPDNTNHVVSVAEAWIPVTNTVSVGKLPGATYVVTNDVWSGTASGHYKLDLPTSKYVVGGKLLVTCGDSDAVRIFVE